VADVKGAHWIQRKRTRRGRRRSGRRDPPSLQWCVLGSDPLGRIQRGRGAQRRRHNGVGGEQRNCLSLREREGRGLVGDAVRDCVGRRMAQLVCLCRMEQERSGRRKRRRSRRSKRSRTRV